MLRNAKFMDSCSMHLYWVHVMQSDINWVLHRKGTFKDMTTYFGLGFFPCRTSRIDEEEAGDVDG